MRLPVRGVKLAILPESGSSGMIQFRTGPEDPQVFFDLFVANPVVVSSTTLGGQPQLVEDLLSGLKGEVFTRSKPASQFKQDIGIASGITRRIDCSADSHNPALSR